MLTTNRTNLTYYVLITTMLLGIFVSLIMLFEKIYHDIPSPFTESDYTLTSIENCQYLVYRGGLAHKGNCTNSIHYIKAIRPE